MQKINAIPLGVLELQRKKLKRDGRMDGRTDRRTDRHSDL